MKEKYGIIDIGSNTMRLVIYEKDKMGRLKEIENIKSVARLRNYLHNDGYFSEKGMHKLITILASFQSITRFHQLKNIKTVATATIRQASNQEEISKLVKEQTDFSLRILSEYEEAFYGFLAVVNTTPFTEGITIDIGGGSTEITYFKNRELVEYHSFPFGALSLKQQFIANSLPTEKELRDLQEYINKNLQSLPWLKNKKVPIIGIGGSARNMVQMDQAMKNYPLAGLHLFEMNDQDIQLLRLYLNSLPNDKLQKIEGLSNDRAELMVPAMIVFEELLQAAQSASFILSRKGLREGIFFEEILKPFGMVKFPSVSEESFDELAHDYEINIENVFQVTKILVQLADELEKLNMIKISKKDMEEIKRAAFVYYLGNYVDSESSSQHTFYLLANRTIDGFMHKERLKLALMASFKNKTVFKQYAAPFKNWFTEEELKKIRLYGALLKFAYSLNGTKRNIVKSLKSQIGENAIDIFIKVDQIADLEQYQADKQKKHLEKLLKHTLNIHFIQTNKK